MPGLSDEELRRRLEAHDYRVPPITGSTRRILVKKLTQLDLDKRDGSGSNGAGIVNGEGGKGSSNRKKAIVSRLIDYSSAEDEQCGSSVAAGPGAVRRASTSSRNSGLLERKRALQRFTARSGRTTNGVLSPPQSPSCRRYGGFSDDHRPNGGQLLNFSEEEEEEGDGTDEDEEESEEEEENVYDRSVQASLGLDGDDTEEEEEVDERNKPPRFSGSPVTTKGSGGGSGRFMSSTPAAPVKSTSSYLPPSPPGSAFPHDSPLRRVIAANKQAFGSLGEVLATLPSSPPSVADRNNRGAAAGLSFTSSKSSNGSSLLSDVTTQSTPPPPRPSQLDSSSRSGCHQLSSQKVSKIILVVAGLFFLLLSYKYANLRPSTDIGHRIPICGGDGGGSCATEDQVENLSLLFKHLVQVLELRSLEQICPPTSPLTESGMTVEDAIEQMQDALPSGLVRPTMAALVALMREHPVWGVEVDDDEERIFESTRLVLVSGPPIDWSCWTAMRSQQLLSLAGVVLVYSAYALLASLFAYAIYRLHVWRQEKRLREQQDVFELVEQVLSMLVTQHRLSTAAQSLNKPCLAISHVRDQLIAPQDRKRKSRVWNKVVKYVRESESRVREDVKKIYGEEHLVWQWVPDVHWTTPMNLHGPNPYVVTPSPPSTSQMAAAAATLDSPPPSFHHAAVTPSPSPSPTSTWQGSAFNSLNRNVAAPMVAPTSCLKVRHMFGQSQVSQPMTSKSPANANSWVWQIKEEILRRCSCTRPPAVIHHIAVDLESAEGCVYIKAKDTEEAGKVFRTLHGQWYRGNLITVKYLREERYYERFPDAKLHSAPLRPSTTTHWQQQQDGTPSSHSKFATAF